MRNRVSNPNSRQPPQLFHEKPGFSPLPISGSPSPPPRKPRIRREAGFDVSDFGSLKCYQAVSPIAFKATRPFHTDGIMKTKPLI